MTENNYEELKAKFMRAYANIPLPLRSEIVVVVDEEPISWHVAKIELNNNTLAAPKILSILEKMEVL